MNELLLPREEEASASCDDALEVSLESDNLKWWELHPGDPQITRHIVLLLLLTVSQFIVSWGASKICDFRFFK